MVKRIDLNCDMGESFGAYKIGCDELVLPYITTANVACGFHAGDPMVMAATVKAAKENGVGVGAHPGYPDLVGFGRRKMTLSFEEIKNDVLYQTGALMAFLKAQGMKMQHMKPHGALGNLAMADEKVAAAVCEAVCELDKDLYMFGHANSVMLKVAKSYGLKTVSEVYGDRAYLDDGHLVPRSRPGAVIHDTEFAVKRAVRMVTEGVVESIDGKIIEIQADSLCVHGDTPAALEFIKQIRAALEAEGVAIKNLAAE
ncbi:MAG: 5-oxoprolinase subunit PxpA [Oscillospiraceae bacterium]|nr:5-oxoprolinase subunit PxpA [Oscillospiraceae bacterium]